MGGVEGKLLGGGLASGQNFDGERRGRLPLRLDGRAQQGQVRDAVIVLDADASGVEQAEALQHSSGRQLDHACWSAARLRSYGCPGILRPASRPMARVSGVAEAGVAVRRNGLG